MYQLLVILILVVCVALAFIVLIQNSKGGGLAANFSAPNQIMGVRKTTDFLEKATWWLAAILIVLSLAATVAIPRNTDNGVAESEVSVLDNHNNVPAAPVATPAEAEAPVAE
ncbi:MAG: preprotein translocase subunit SecG [Bacteroidales bacterium]|nr:preprotein translocase subunit SecG [Candidatus Colimorpha pelethequi]MCQ2261707.1 preprotein translocase subunit SecG [Bacteroidales bacterium]